MHVVVAVDESDPSKEAFEFALEEFPDAKLTALHVIDPYDLGTRTREDLDEGVDSVVQAERADAEALFELLTETAGDREIETEAIIGKPDRQIVDYVEDVDADHIVVGSHGRSGLSRVLLGSVAETVARRASVPVTIVR